MANFIAGSACRGARPKKINLKNKKVRDDLIAEMMSQRNVLRFINAPKGFGKSTLAAQYAEIVFSFKKVYWINCKSPCFIRDLDSYNIVEQLIQVCENTNLVVFDNLGILNEERLTKFSQTIDELLEYDCEVIVISDPQNTSLNRFQPDCLLINTQKLLARDSELNSDYTFNKDALSDIERIPAVAFSENKNFENILLNAVEEKFPDSINFSLFMIYLLKKGSIENFSNLISKADVKLLTSFYSEYIYFGIDINKTTFSVPEVSIPKLMKCFNSYIELFIKKSSCIDKKEFIEKAINLLINSGNHERAVELIKYIGNKEEKIKYLELWNQECIEKMFMSSLCGLYDTLQFSKNNNGENNVFHSIRLAILGKKREAIRYAYGVLDSEFTSIDNKLLATLVFLRFGNDNEKYQTMKLMRYLNNDFKIDSYINNKKLNKKELFKYKTIYKLVSIYLAIFSDSFNPFEVWLKNTDKILDNGDIICAEAILASLKHINNNCIKSENMIPFFLSLSRYFNVGSKSNENINFYTYALISTYLSTCSYIEDIIGDIPWKINNKLYENFNNYKPRFKKEKDSIADYSERTIEPFIDAETFSNIDILSNKHRIYSEIFPHVGSAKEQIPILTLNIFGGLSAYIGEKEVIRSDFGRQNIKLICCILVIENGGEINKDRLADLVWPDSDKPSQRVNINSNWAILRKLLSFQNGECPYLIRNQNSYKLNSDYFISDLQKLEDLCADLTMGTIDSFSWWEKINKNKTIFDSDLLPSENNNSFILRKRHEYKTKIINALIAASQRLLEAGEIQQSLWFATKALCRDAAREDVYLTLMNAQIRAGQRTPAIETYLACQKYLKNELGIDPSKRIKNLYQTVLDDKCFV